MKNLTLLLALCMCVSSMHAQITITSSNTPSPGESFSFVVDPASTIGVAHGGINQTWDFSQVSGSLATINHTNLSGSADPGSFPNANLVQHDPSTGENLFFKSNAELSIVGQLIPGVTRVIFNNSREFLTFPMTYNDEINETFSGTIENLQVSQTFDRSGTVHSKADGYGTLILPYGTVNNVLRIRIAYNYQDLLSGVPVADYSDTIYIWFNSSTSIWIASQTLSYIAGIPWINQATFIDQSDLVTAVENLSGVKPRPQIFPNPTSGILNVQNIHLVEHIKLFDLHGKLVMQIEDPGVRERIPVHDLSPGIYLVEFSSDITTFTDKLVVQ